MSTSLAFCPYCGTRLAAAGLQFCVACGRRLADAGPSSELAVSAESEASAETLAHAEPDASDRTEALAVAEIASTDPVTGPETPATPDGPLAAPEADKGDAEAAQALAIDSEGRATKRCPMCAEDVWADARICRFCRYEFPPADPAAPVEPRPLAATRSRVAAAASTPGGDAAAGRGPVSEQGLGRWRILYSSDPAYGPDDVASLRITHAGVEIATATARQLLPWERVGVKPWGGGKIVVLDGTEGRFRLAGLDGQQDEAVAGLIASRGHAPASTAGPGLPADLGPWRMVWAWPLASGIPRLSTVELRLDATGLTITSGGSRLLVESGRLNASHEDGATLVISDGDVGVARLAPLAGQDMATVAAMLDEHGNRSRSGLALRTPTAAAPSAWGSTTGAPGRTVQPAGWRSDFNPGAYGSRQSGDPVTSSGASEPRLSDGIRLAALAAGGGQAIGVVLPWATTSGLFAINASPLNLINLDSSMVLIIAAAAAAVLGAVGIAIASDPDWRLMARWVLGGASLGTLGIVVYAVSEFSKGQQSGNLFSSLVQPGIGLWVSGLSGLAGILMGIVASPSE